MATVPITETNIIVHNYDVNVGEKYNDVVSTIYDVLQREDVCAPNNNNNSVI